MQNDQNYLFCHLGKNLQDTLCCLQTMSYKNNQEDPGVRVRVQE